MKDGVDDGTRTHDNRDHNPGLYQLSYAHHRFELSPAPQPLASGSRPSRAAGRGAQYIRTGPNLYSLRKMARPEGLEPPTTGLEGWCSIRLSYGQIVGQLVGVERFELPTSWSQTRRATRLRYTPKGGDYSAIGPARSICIC